MYLKRDEEKPLGKRVRLSTLLSGSTYNVCRVQVILYDRFEILPVRRAVEEAWRLVAHKPGHK